MSLDVIYVPLPFLVLAAISLVVSIPYFLDTRRKTRPKLELGIGVALILAGVAELVSVMVQVPLLSLFTSWWLTLLDLISVVALAACGAMFLLMLRRTKNSITTMRENMQKPHSLEDLTPLAW